MTAVGVVVMTIMMMHINFCSLKVVKFVWACFEYNGFCTKCRSEKVRLKILLCKAHLPKSSNLLK